MASPCAETQLKTAEQLLHGLALYDKPLDIPGNFRAKQRRVKHDDSKLVFPTRRRRPKESDEYKTHYNHQFRSKPNARPSSPRPCSPTRRNNPHPSKNFLNWRIPTRVFDYGKVKNANISFLKSNIVDSHQRFYDDYTGRAASRDGKEIDPRELLDMAKTYAAALQKERTKAKNKKFASIQNNSTYQAEQLPNRSKERVTLGMKSPPNSPVGIKLPNVLTKSWSPELSTSSKMKGAKPTGKKSKGTSPTSMSPFSSWYDALGAGVVDPSSAENSEQIVDEEVQEALGALKPEALEAIETWLLSASDEERQIAMKFIEAIILASVQESKVKTSSPSRTQTNSPTGAVPMQFLAPYPGIQNIKSKTKGAHHHNHTSSKACEVCKKKELESALQKLQAIASLPSDVPAITELLNPLHPSVLYEKEVAKEAASGRKLPGATQPKLLNRRMQDRFVPNKGSVFMNSKRTSGRHFTIHPEWN